MLMRCRIYEAGLPNRFVRSILAQSFHRVLCTQKRNERRNDKRKINKKAADMLARRVYISSVLPNFLHIRFDTERKRSEQNSVKESGKEKQKLLFFGRQGKRLVC